MKTEHEQEIDRATEAAANMTPEESDKVMMDGIIIMEFSCFHTAEKASIEHFLNGGAVNGSFKKAIENCMKEYVKYKTGV